MANKLMAMDKALGSAHQAEGGAAHKSSTRNPLRDSFVLRAGVLLVSVLVSSLLAEGALRLFFSHRLELIEDERSLLYRFDSVLGWFPIPNSRSHFFASRDITVINNSKGFRGTEQVANEKPGVLFLGDSFVWGYDVEAEERFTEKLQAKHPEWNVLNLGVSGYGTDQEYLLLQKYVGEYRPRVVFLVYSVETDDEDNSRNVRYGGYYKPYCTVVNDRLQLKGVPVPRSERAFWAEHPQLARSFLARLLARGYFALSAPKEVRVPSPTGAIIRTMQKFVESTGASFGVGLTASNPKIEEYLHYYGIRSVDLSTPLRYPNYGWHWTPEGHAFVCGKIDEFLTGGNYLRENGAAH
jgi:hypothetical protein